MATALRARGLDRPRDRKHSRGHTATTVNVGPAERWLSLLGGAGLTLYGLSRESWGGLGLALVGASLVYRGASGHCSLYGSLGITTADEQRGPRSSVPAGRGARADCTIVVDRPPAEVFRFWRNLENLPRFMRHLESVKNLDLRRSHWVARAPAGQTVEWDAVIINERPNELIAWRSLEGADVDCAGSVHFRPTRDGRGTEIQVEMRYNPPTGRFGSMMAWLLGEEPNQQIRNDLEQFKRLAESGVPL